MFFLKGILIGLIIGLPAGAIGALCVQRMLAYGIRYGIVTGLGSSLVDCFYAAIGVFGLTFLSEFILRYQSVITLIGGLLILVMGIGILRKKPKPEVTTPERPTRSALLLSSLGVGITNPTAIIGFLFCFSYFGIDGKQGFLNGLILVVGVLIGTLFWWGALALLTRLIRRKYGENASVRLNRFFGIVMILFSIAVFVKGVFGLGSKTE